MQGRAFCWTIKGFFKLIFGFFRWVLWPFFKIFEVIYSFIDSVLLAQDDYKEWKEKRKKEEERRKKNIANGYPAFKKTSVFFTFLMSFITLGIYLPYWFISRRDDINRLKSKQELSSAPAKILLVLYILSALMTPFTMDENSVWYNIDMMISFGGGLVLLYLAFQVRRMINEHLGEKKISGVLTFFLNIWYLQYKINREFVDGQREAA